MRSLQTHIEIKCPSCGIHSGLRIWVLIDADERPDLLRALIREEIQQAACDNCGHVLRLELPLLVLRRSAADPLVFSPSKLMDDAENKSRRSQLIRILKTPRVTLGEEPELLELNWDEVEDIPRQHLKNYLTQDLEQEKVRLIFLREAGNVKIAVEAARTVASLTETYYGPDNLEYGTATNNLGVVLNEAGLFREFEAAHRESLRVRASAGELSEEVAQSLDNLAQSLSNSGDAEAALTIAQRALQVREQVFGSDHLEVAFSLNTLANIYIAQEKFVEAEAALNRCLDIRERHLGSDHVDVGVTLNNLGGLFRRTNRFAEARANYERCLRIFRSALPDNHPYLIGLNHNLSFVQMAIGDLASAANRARTTAAGARATFGEGNPFLANVLRAQSTVAAFAGNVTQARVAAEEALSIARLNFGDLHSSVVAALNALAVAQGKARNWQAQLETVNEALSIALRVFGPDHADTGIIYNNLACGLWATGDEAAALEAIRTADEILDKSLRRVLAISDDQQRMLYLEQAHANTSVHLSLLVTLQRMTGWTSTEALQLVLRRKMVALDYARVQFESMNATVSHPDQTRWRDLQSAIANLNAYGEGGPDLRERLGQTLAEFAILNRKIIREIPAEAWADVIGSVTVEDIQKKLGPRSALIEIAQYHPYTPSERDVDRSPRYLGFAVTTSKPGLVWSADLGSVAEIDELVERYRIVLQGGADPLSQGSPGNEQVIGTQLEQLVLGPLRSALEQVDILTIAADGKLASMPFSILPIGDGRRVIDRFAVACVSCGRDLVRATVSASPELGPPLVLADPDYGEAIVGKESAFERLPGTREEGEAIASMLGVEALVGKSATKEAIFSRPRPRVLHIATHGFYFPRPQDPVGRGTVFDQQPGANSANSVIEIDSAVFRPAQASWIGAGRSQHEHCPWPLGHHRRSSNRRGSSCA